MRRRISVEVLDSIFILRGWQAHRLALEAGLRPTYSGVHQGWMADTSRLSTFEAYCAHRRVWLEVTNAPEPSQEPAQASTSAAPDPASDVPLFDLGGR
ncbi:MAG TPA: hypothetical protein VHO29_04100 [Marmoricola sp.]|nr:hypothetical protein [Marmoricola sp.]